MEAVPLDLVLAVLAFASALNLFLVLRLARIVLPPAGGTEILVPLVGGLVPAFEARRLADGSSLASAELAGTPTVLIFLSPACATCRARVSELAEILPATLEAGVSLWIACADDTHDLATLTGGSPLESHCLAVGEEVRKALNPLHAAPLYLFIDEALTVQAGGYLGDGNWQAFVAQMREYDAPDEVGGAGPAPTGRAARPTPSAAVAWPDPGASPRRP